MKRLIWADSLKGCLIVLVVLGHAIQEVIKGECFDNHLWNIIYSFHMPAFIAVSGYFNYRLEGTSNRLSIIYRRFQQLFIPFFVWTIVRILLNPPYGKDTFINAFLYPDSSFWFLWVLFWISVLFFWGDWIAVKMRIKQELTILSLCALFILVMIFAEIRILGFQFIAYYFLFYSLGLFIHKYKEHFVWKQWSLIISFLAWCVLAWYWRMHGVPSLIQGLPVPATLSNYAYRFVAASIAIYVLLGIAPKLLNKNSLLNKPFIQLGSISLGIYTAHILIIPFIVKGLLSFNNMPATLVIVIAFIGALSISWFFTWVLDKNKITKRIMLGKIK